MARDNLFHHGDFAIYPVFVVMTLMFFGNLSDHIGRRDAILLGLAASTGGALIFVAAPDAGWIFAGRALMGVGVGLSAGPSAASPPRPRRSA